MLNSLISTKKDKADILTFADSSLELHYGL